MALWPPAFAGCHLEANSRLAWKAEGGLRSLLQGRSAQSLAARFEPAKTSSIPVLVDYAADFPGFWALVKSSTLRRAAMVTTSAQRNTAAAHVNPPPNANSK